MKILKLIAAAISVTAFAVALSASVGSAQTSWDDSNLETRQRTSWGLSDFGDSLTVNRFSSLGWALEESDGQVYVGGNFLNLTNGVEVESQPYMAAVDLRTGVPNFSFAPEVGGPVLVLQNAPDGGMFVGGEMKTWNGVQVGGLVKIDPETGERDGSFSGRVFGDVATVRDLHIGHDGFLYVAGSFTSANDGGAPIAVSGVVRFNLATGALDRSWIPDASSFEGVWGIALSHTTDSVYVAGKSVQSRNKGLKAFDRSDASQETWNDFAVNKTATWMYDVEALPNGNVFITGTEHSTYVHDENQGMALIKQHTTQKHSEYQVNLMRSGGDGQNLEVIGDRVYATCHCWGSHISADEMVDLTVKEFNWDLASLTQPYEYTGSVSGVIAYDGNTGERDQRFNPYMAGDVGGWAVLPASDGCLWVTGGFNSVGEIGSTAPGRDLVRLCNADGGSAALAAPASCEATVSGETVTVVWDAVDGAEKYVVSRSVDGGNVSWRGATEDTTFVDTNKDGVLAYSVVSKASIDKSSAVDCVMTQIEPEPTAVPTNCTFQVSGDSVNVSWSGAVGGVKHVVYRSVDGSQQYWRGAVDGTSFVDSNRDATLEYFVLAVFEDGSRSERVSCVEGEPGPPEPQPEPVSAVASCGAAIIGGQAVISWTAVADAGAEYVVSRSVDGGNVWWRGKVAGTSFTDSIRSGTIDYFVETKVGNDRSERVACSPSLEG